MDFDFIMLKARTAEILEGVAECLKDDPDHQGYNDLIHTLDHAKGILRCLRDIQRFDSQD